MTQQLLKKELFVVSKIYIESFQSLLPEKEYEMLQSAIASQGFLDLLNKMVEVYAQYLSEEELLFLLNNFKESKPILTTLLQNMPSIVQTMTEAFETFQEDLHLIGEEYAT